MRFLFCIAALALGLTGGKLMADDKKPVVVIETSMGNIKVELDAEKAPISVANFLSYVDKKHYDNTIFHRVIPTFMIQGGGFSPGMKEKETDKPIKNESSNGLSNKKYTLAMARTSVPDSATSQFFINVGDNDFLDKAKSRDGVGYAVFGKVIEGADVVEKIKNVPTGNVGPHGDVPKTDVVMKTVKRADAK